MIAKRVVLTTRARHDVRQATAWYRTEGGAPLARRWVVALADALRQVGAHPKAGAMRYAAELKLPGLCFWPVSGFPYQVFYVEQADRIDVGRVLHGKRDIPAWIREPE